MQRTITIDGFCGGKYVCMAIQYADEKMADEIKTAIRKNEQVMNGTGIFQDRVTKTIHFIMTEQRIKENYGGWEILRSAVVDNTPRMNRDIILNEFPAKKGYKIVASEVVNY